MPKRAPLDLPTLHPPSCQVKRERSLTPIVVERRLVTSGTKRFAPIPDDCLSSCMGYRQNRVAWIARCTKEFEALSLTLDRKLIRDDGLIIDWYLRHILHVLFLTSNRKSTVPVWSDTLKPDSQDLAATIILAHRSNAHWHRTSESPSKSVIAISTKEYHGPVPSPPIPGDIPDDEPPSKKRLPVPPQPGSKRRKDASQPISVSSRPSGSGSFPPPAERPRLPDETEHETASHSRSCGHMFNLADNVHIPLNSSTLPPKYPSAVRDGSILRSLSSAEEKNTEMTMTMNYLRRYVQTYEADRASLASAYARNASLAYRAHHIAPNISGGTLSILADSPRRFSSGTKWTRLDIATTLLSLPRLHSNTQSPGITQIEYDIFYLGTEYGMFAVCRVVAPTQTVVHNFILQKKEVDVEDAVTEGVWPLTATAHQILAFQA